MTRLTISITCPKGVSRVRVALTTLRLGNACAIYCATGTKSAAGRSCTYMNRIRRPAPNLFEPRQLKWRKVQASLLRDPLGQPRFSKPVQYWTLSTFR